MIQALKKENMDLKEQVKECKQQMTTTGPPGQSVTDVLFSLAMEQEV